MLQINQYKDAKKLTHSIYDFLKNKKTSLSEFRTYFASQLGFKNLQDIFDKENKTKREYIQSRYISYLDDPRVTLEVAERIYNYKENELKDYFERNFNNDLFEGQKVLFPIKNIDELSLRCEEIMIIFNKTDYFSIQHLFQALLKISFENKRIAYIGDRNKPYANPELQMAISLLDYVKTNLISKFIIKDFLDSKDSDFNSDNCHYELFKKIEIWSKSIIWTQSNVGKNIHSIASLESKREYFK